MPARSAPSHLRSGAVRPLEEVGDRGVGEVIEFFRVEIPGTVCLSVNVAGWGYASNKLSPVIARRKELAGAPRGQKSLPCV
jgi:hypothetical protein